MQFVREYRSSLGGIVAIAASLISCGSAGHGETKVPSVASGNAAGTASGTSPGIAKPEHALTKRYRAVADKIIKAALADSGSWEKLQHLTDRIGHRLSGSAQLDDAIAWAAAAMKSDGHQNVHTEKVMVPHWVRGDESVRLLAPVERELSMIGLGGTVGTPKAGVSAEVVVVSRFEQLQALGDSVKGKIVLYNVVMPPFDAKRGSGYDVVSKYRVFGPSKAAKLGAVAVLMRSVTAHSLRTPHTGTLWYTKDAPKIPAAAVTTEDADLIARLAASGEKVVVRIRSGAKMLPDAISANVVGEILGSEKPEEVVVIAGHLDSWDVGQGAHDDGAGCVIMMQALTVLRRLGLRPKRTIRVVLFTNEENGGRGSAAYVEAHKSELGQHVLGLESDSGGFAPLGFEVSGDATTLEHATAVAQLLKPIGAASTRKGYSGADVGPMEKHGVPGIGLWVDETHYFDYHHTAADTLDKVNPGELARDVAAAAVLAFVAADMPERFGGAAAK